MARKCPFPYHPLTRKNGEHLQDSNRDTLRNKWKEIEVAKISEIPAGTMKHIEAKGKELCIANVSGKFFMIEDRCGHQNASLAIGTLQG
jgi:hypothetical protein